MKYDKTEGTWQDHGDVEVQTEDGTVLGQEKKMTHNNAWNRWADLEKKSEELAKTCVEAFKKQAQDAPKKDAKKEAAKEEEAKAPEEEAAKPVAA